MFPSSCFSATSTSRPTRADTTCVSITLSLLQSSSQMPSPPSKAAAKAPAKTGAPAKKSEVAPIGGKPTAKQIKGLKKLETHARTAYLLSRIRAKAKAKNIDPALLIQKKGKIVTKEIGGEKNGGKRRVLVGKKVRSYYPTEDVPKKKRGRATVHKHEKKFKAGLEPGRVVILLAGRHKGKRVVVLKTLPSGLLLITGPYVLNHCPIRRMHQSFVIVTSTKLDMSEVTASEKITDSYFRKKKAVVAKKAGDDLFQKKTKKKRYTPSVQRKKDQIEVDKQILKAVNKTGEDKFLMRGYLSSFFKLRNNVYPHRLKF